MAPVARGIPDREKDRNIPAARLLEREVSPRVPVDGVLPVLAEIRAGLGRESVERRRALYVQPGQRGVYRGLGGEGERPPCGRRLRKRFGLTPERALHGIELRPDVGQRRTVSLHSIAERGEALPLLLVRKLGWHE